MTPFSLRLSKLPLHPQGFQNVKAMKWI